MGHGFRFLPHYSTTPPYFFLFFFFHIHSFFKMFIIIRFYSFDNILYCISRKTVDTEYTYYSWCMTSTDIVKWIKMNYYENFEKGMNMKKRGSSREKGRGNEIHAPRACAYNSSNCVLIEVALVGCVYYNK